MENKIKITGKVAKFPKNTRADHALIMMETIKINPNKIWYILIESQDNVLKTVKYNQKNKLDLYMYTETLKQTYMKVFNDETVLEKINNIEVFGENDFSVMKNIPTDVILENGQTLLAKITSDLMLILNE